MTPEECILSLIKRYETAIRHITRYNPSNDQLMIYLDRRNIDLGLCCAISTSFKGVFSSSELFVIQLLWRVHPKPSTVYICAIPMHILRGLDMKYYTKITVKESLQYRLNVLRKMLKLVEK